MSNKLVQRWCVSTMVFAFALFGAGCSKESDVTTLSMAHSLDTKHPVHLAMVHLSQALEQNSGGTMRLEIYPSGQLGSEREVIELLQIGSLAMTKVSASSLEAFVPSMQVFSLPYLFKNNRHFWQVLNSDLGKELLDAGTPYRIRGLGYYDAGSRSFYSTNIAIHSPADLAGQKIRVMNSQSAVNMVRAMGGSATPVSWGELYTALQQGVVDGAENNPPSFYLSKHYEVAKFYTLDEHTAIPDVVVISERVWQGLNAQQQHWLADAMAASTEYQRGLWDSATQEALDAVQQAGVQIIEPDKELFKNSVEKYLGQQTSLSPLIERIQKLDLAEDNHHE